MIATYNLRAVRVLIRAEARRRRPWQAVPMAAWLLLLDAFVVQIIALACVGAGQIKLHPYLPAIHGADALTSLAALLSVLSMAVAARARWLARSSRRNKAVVLPPTQSQIAPMVRLA